MNKEEMYKAPAYAKRVEKLRKDYYIRVAIKVLFKKFFIMKAPSKRKFAITGKQAFKGAAEVAALHLFYVSYSFGVIYVQKK